RRHGAVYICGATQRDNRSLSFVGGVDDCEIVGHTRLDPFPVDVKLPASLHWSLSCERAVEVHSPGAPFANSPTKRYHPFETRALTDFGSPRVNSKFAQCYVGFNSQPS